MSAIVHACVSCGHSEHEHSEHGMCQMKTCPKGVHQPDRSGPPELVPSFDRDGQRIDRIIKPGTRVKQWGTMCDCEQCQALYVSLGGAS